MGKEPFSKTLEIQLFYTDNLYSITGKTKKTKFIEIAKETIYTIDMYGDFLNNIPINDREKFNNKIMRWICSVYDDLSRINDNTKIHARASDKKASDLKAINHVIDIIGDLPYFEMAEEAHLLLKQLHNAIKNDNKKEVLHNRYYRKSLTTKKEMECIIKEMVKIYRIPKVKTRINTLIEKLPSYKNIR